MTELSPQISKANNEAPLLVLSATFSVLPRIQPLSSLNFDDICDSEKCIGIFLLYKYYMLTLKIVSLNPETIPTCVEEMYKSSDSGETTDLLQIALMYEGIHLLSDGKQKAGLMNMLGDICFKHCKPGNINDLHRAVYLYSDAVQEARSTSDYNLVYWVNLGEALQSRFARSGDIKDIGLSIQVFEDAVTQALDSHPDKPVLLGNLGFSLWLHFRQQGDYVDLIRSIQMMENALMLVPDGSPCKSTILDNLGTSLRSHFELLEDLADISRSVQLIEEAIILTPEGHDKPSKLSNLGISLCSHYRQLGDPADLDRSIQVIDACSRWPC